MSTYVWNLRSIGVVVSSRVTSLSPTCGENRTTQPSLPQYRDTRPPVSALYSQLFRFSLSIVQHLIPIL